MTRYARQERFAGVGVDGQRRLRAARVLVAGCGALGSAVAEAIVRAGVASVTVVDRDCVELSNLQRQTLFDEDDALGARPKAVAAEARLRRLNSEVAVRGIVADLDAALAGELVRAADLVLDGTDNLETRYVVNDVCLRAGVPWIYGACVAAHGAVLVVRPGLTPCLRCVLGERPPLAAGEAAESSETTGIVAPIVQVVAGVQGSEALKLLVGRVQELLPGLITLDVWRGLLEIVGFEGRAPWCPSCASRRYDYADEALPSAVAPCGPNAVQIRGEGPLDLARLAASLRGAGEVQANEYLVRLRSPEGELIVFGDGRAIVKGTADAARARSLYARFVGA